MIKDWKYYGNKLLKIIIHKNDLGPGKIDVQQCYKTEIIKDM